MWLSSEIHYKRVPIKKKTLFGWRQKLGYELTKDLRWWDDKRKCFYVLRAGYVWDGSSYPKILNWLVGNKDLNGLLAASAFHDIHNAIPARYVSSIGGKKKMYHVKYNIKDGANLYHDMLNAWPNDDEKPNEWQSDVQRVGLNIFQPIYRLFTSENDWEKV